MHSTTCVVVLFEDRSLDNLARASLRPRGREDVRGRARENLSNPIPEWLSNGADREVVPYTVTADMDSPNPDSGEEWYHTNTQLFNTIDEHNRSRSVKV